MSEILIEAPLFMDVTGGGVLAKHPLRAELPVKLAPSSDEYPGMRNTIRPGLMAIGCYMMPETYFDFDSSFVRPENRDAFVKFDEFRNSLAENGDKPPLSIFGHADPVNTPEYNKKLSGRRAQAIYGLLTRNVDLWDELYEKEWKVAGLQKMLKALGRHDGPVNGYLDGPTTKEIKQYQTEKDLPNKSGFPDKTTRKTLYLEYMNAICPCELKPADFLAQGLDPKQGGKGDYQGCSEYNPVLLFSQKEEKAFQNPARKEERNAANMPNRRVLAFLFKPGSRIDPAKWPCPRVKEGVKDCEARFWSDSDTRLKARYPDARRQYQRIARPVGVEPEETFACRFYDGLARHSPCEAGLKLWRLRLLQHSPTPTSSVPFANRRFVVIAGESETAAVLRGTTDAHGVLAIPVLDENTRMTVKLDAWTDLFAPEQTAQEKEAAEKPKPDEVKSSQAFPDEDKFLVFTLDAGALVEMGAGDLEVKQRLYNLGYGPSNLAAWTQQDYDRAVAQFQKTQDIQEQGAGEQTRERLKYEHGS